MNQDNKLKTGKAEKIILIVFFSIIISLSYNRSFAQDFTKHSIKIGTGIGASMGGSNDGLGFVWSVGYQREIWSERLRFNPNFSVGIYNSKLITDARDQYFNSLNLDANLFFDLIKIKSFSLVIGGGGLMNNMKGLIGTGGLTEGYLEPQSSEFFNRIHFGAYLGSGFRIDIPHKRTAFNIMPFNLHIGNNYFFEYHLKIELDIKF